MKMAAASPRWISMPSEFPVLPLVEEMGSCTDQLVLELMWLDLPEAVQAASVIRQLASDVSEQEAQPIVMDVRPPNDTDPQFKERIHLDIQPIPIAWPPLVAQGMVGKFTIFGEEERIDMPTSQRAQ